MEKQLVRLIIGVGIFTSGALLRLWDPIPAQAEMSAKTTTQIAYSGAPSQR